MSSTTHDSLYFVHSVNINIFNTHYIWATCGRDKDGGAFSHAKTPSLHSTFSCDIIRSRGIGSCACPQEYPAPFATKFHMDRPKKSRTESSHLVSCRGTSIAPRTIFVSACNHFVFPKQASKRTKEKNDTKNVGEFW